MRRYVTHYWRAPCLGDGGRVRLQASSGEYVVAVGNGGAAVRADQPRPGPRGRFTLVDHNGGPCVASGDVVSLHTSDAVLSLLGAAGERIGYDRWLKANTVKRRTHSLFRQGLMLYHHLPNWPEDRIRPLMETFGSMLTEQRVYREVFGVI